MTKGRKKARGVGAVYQPSYVVKASGERKTSSVWWVYYHHRGRLYRESSNSTKRGDATQLLRKRLAEVGQGRVIGPQAEKTTFEELAEMLVNDYQPENSRKSTHRIVDALEHLRKRIRLAESRRYQLGQDHGIRARVKAPPLRQSTGSLPRSSAHSRSRCGRARLFSGRTWRCCAKTIGAKDFSSMSNTSQSLSTCLQT